MMYRCLLLSLCICFSSMLMADQVRLDKSDCSMQKGDKTFPLYGKVKLVEYGEDYRVEIVEYNADLNIKIVDYNADDCGEVKIVDYGEDVRVKIVQYNGDLTVKVCKYNSGLQ